MDVSVIIVNYNTCQMTSDCLLSVQQHTTGLEYEIILVDNASIDGSDKVFRKYDFIRYIYSDENIGFGSANNLGMQNAKGDYFFLLNSDTLLVNNAIKEFYDYAEIHEKRAFYGCWLEDKQGNHINSGGSIPTINSLLWNLCKSYIPGRHEGDKTVYYSEEPCYQIGYVTGADMFFHRSVYENTKGFDPQFFMYSEESDWQRTAFKKDINAYILNAPRIIHLCGGSQKVESTTFNIAHFRIFMKSQYYYIRKEYNGLQYIYYRITNALLYIPKLLLRRTKSFAAIKVLFE